MKKVSLENMGMPAPYYGFTYLRYVPMVYELLLQKSVAKVNVPIYKSLTSRHFVTDYDLFLRINFTQIKEILLRINNIFFEIVDKNKLEVLIHQAEYNPNFKLSSLNELIALKLFFDVVY